MVDTLVCFWKAGVAEVHNKLIIAVTGMRGSKGGDDQRVVVNFYIT